MEDRTILESIQDFKEYAPRSNANLGYWDEKGWVDKGFTKQRRRVYAINEYTQSKDIWVSIQIDIDWGKFIKN
jgi:hypothetical protein